MNETEKIKGWKVFNPDFTCRGTQYEVGGEYTMKGKPKCCERGFHFCKNAVDCFNYYGFDPDNIVCEVEAYGDVHEEGDKCATNALRVLRQLTWSELLALVNTGKGNSGKRNSGDRNSGHSNSGDWNSGHSNSGHRNSGDRNSGDSNSGDWNSGHSNSGDSNSGHRNSGDRNSGHRNSGDWNACNFSSGVFNTEEQKIYLFNKPSDWTYSDWRNSKAASILSGLVLNKWVSWSEMTDEEKAQEPNASVRDGYLKQYEYKEACATLWAGLSDAQKREVQSLPNFDAQVFEQITGIKI